MQRLDFGRSNMTWKKEWERVVFSDEKKFNLEGPDGYAYYFHDLRKEEHTLDRLHSRAGGVMVWGAITYFGTIVQRCNENGFSCSQRYFWILGMEVPAG
ncbi:hypothetical protein ACLKA7_001928 [Drosophila subpalustris]